MRRDGPPDKHGYGGLAEPSRKQGAVYHSMEGSYEAALGELDNLARRASWTFSNGKDGRFEQHYPVGFHTWANGSLDANMRFVSCENEGRAGERLTQQQIDNLVQLTEWLRDTQGWTTVARQETLWEHREMTRFGAAPTACPSGRIPWGIIIARVEEPAKEDDVKPYLVKEKGKPYVYMMFGIFYSYLRDFKDSDALGIPRDITEVPAGTLARSYVRADML